MSILKASSARNPNDEIKKSMFDNSPKPKAINIHLTSCLFATMLF